ncbi:MAG: zinc ribbon domain-containing protein [Acidobacteriota bacterium]
MKQKIKEYFCRKCNRSFYILIEEGKKAVCPECKSEDLVNVPNSPKKNVQINCKCSKD